MFSVLVLYTTFSLAARLRLSKTQNFDLSLPQISASLVVSSLIFVSLGFAFNSCSSHVCFCCLLDCFVAYLFGLFLIMSLSVVWLVFVVLRSVQMFSVMFVCSVERLFGCSVVRLFGCSVIMWLRHFLWLPIVVRTTYRDRRVHFVQYSTQSLVYTTLILGQPNSQVPPCPAPVPPSFPCPASLRALFPLHPALVVRAPLSCPLLFGYSSQNLHAVTLLCFEPSGRLVAPCTHAYLILQSGAK